MNTWIIKFIMKNSIKAHQVELQNAITVPRN
jgi:hypothetical protein